MQGLQDIILALMSVLFAVALVPSITGNNKPEKATAIFSAGAAAVIAVTYFTMAMPFSTAAAAVTAGLWTILATQKR